AVSVQLKDAYDNDVPLSSIAVTLAIATGTDTLKGTKTQLTDATGLASFNDLYIHLIGSKTILATSTSLTSATSNSFTITPATAVRIVVETASDGSGSSVPAQTVISGNSISCYAITRDTFNNFIANNIATWSLKNTTGGVVGSDLIPFDGNRAATFTGHLSGSSNIEASSGSLTPIPSGTITVAAGNAKQLGFTQQPTNTIAGNSITPAVTVQLKDSLGNNVSIPGVLITLTLTTGTGTLSGTTTQSTDGAGLTIFNNLSINKTGSKILTATSGSLTSATSNSFTISAATPVNISFTQQPPSSDTAGTILTPSIIVNIKDSFDNNVPLAGDTIDISLSSGSGTLSGTLMKVTDANGAVTFDNLSIEKSGIKTLTASSNNYGSAVSNTFTINPSAAYKIIVETTADGNGTTVPAQTLSSGSTIIGYAITRDVYDNLLPKDTALTWSLQFITDSVKQTDLVSNVSCKCATFTARLIGSAQIHVQKAGLLSINSGTITIIAGDPSRLAFSQQPSDAIAGAIISPPIQVCIKDFAGNNIQQDGDTINITLKSGTGVLNGSTLRLTDATGIATFNDLSITLPGQKNLQASHRVYTAVISDTFSLGTYTITASAGANGTISPSGAIGVIHGANQSFTISPNTGYHIFDVLVDGTSAGPVTNYTFNNVTGNHTISASFAIDTLTITASSSTNGTITTSGAVKVTYGSNQTFTFNPSAGYHVLNFIVDGTTQTAAPSYTFTNVITNHTISVNFVPDSLSITSSTGGNGIISPLGIVRVGYGMNKSFTFTPDTGYHIFDVIVDGSSVGRPTSYTFNNVTVNHTISVSFAIDTLTITSTAGSNGAITPPGTIKLTYGFSQTFIISPEIGYHILDVVVDGSSVGAVPSYTFSNIKTNHSISASFAINTYTITAAAGANGTISPSGLIPINHGSNQTFSIRPNTGYHIDSVKVDNIYVGTDTIYTFTNVTTDHTITATFVPNIITVTVQTNPTGLSFTVDGTTYSTTQIFIWTAAENHIISTDSIQSGTPGTRNVWNSWTNAATIIDTITPLVNTTFTANFTTQYYLTMNANPGGTVTPSSGWFNKSQNVAITGIPDSN
ncbi:MAG: hypothetical protein HY800_09700, partial [Ignavibacteriales bacterium]|nr:hypothetical protein [Ignavibacteriales bacterium]